MSSKKNVNYNKLIDIRKKEWEQFFTKYKHCDEDEEFDFSTLCNSSNTEEKLINNSLYENTSKQLGNLINISNKSDEPSFISKFKNLEIEHAPKVVCVKRGLKTKKHKRKRSIVPKLPSHKIINNNTKYEITKICFKDKFLPDKLISKDDIIETFDSRNKKYTIKFLADNPDNLFDDDVNFNFNKTLTKSLHNKHKCLKKLKENSNNNINVIKDINKPSKNKKTDKFENSVNETSYTKRKRDWKILNLEINNFDDDLIMFGNNI